MVIHIVLLEKLSLIPVSAQWTCLSNKTWCYSHYLSRSIYLSHDMLSNPVPTLNARHGSEPFILLRIIYNKHVDKIQDVCTGAVGEENLVSSK